MYADEVFQPEIAAQALPRQCQSHELQVVSEALSVYTGAHAQSHPKKSLSLKAMGCKRSGVHLQ
jgi:hypothetical protein